MKSASVLFSEMSPDVSYEAEFNDWYDRDHIPTLLECKDWLMVRRFRIIDGEPENWTHLALHYLADSAAALSIRCACGGTFMSELLGFATSLS